MKKRFKKIYIEITNACNLNCSFCIKNKRPVEYMDYENFKQIIDKIKDYTDEIYLHILGEPLIHKDVNKFISYAKNLGIMVNITTNGYLINNLDNNGNLHRLNISLHSFSEKYRLDIVEYLDNIFDTVDDIKNNTFVSLRLWVGNKNTATMLNYINDRYNTKIDNLSDNKKIKISSNLMIDTFHEFIWPDLNNNYYNENGRCMGLIDHIGILSDGTVVPCCLDSLGIIKLGNIYNDNIDNILQKQVVIDMIEGFRKGYKCQELCKHCSFLNTEKK